MRAFLIGFFLLAVVCQLVVVPFTGSDGTVYYSAWTLPAGIPIDAVLLRQHIMRTGMLGAALIALVEWLERRRGRASVSLDALKR